MGRAKMMLMPQYYLHGTPDSLSLGTAASHGCIRMHNRDVLEVARQVIEAGAPALADSAGLLLADSVRSRTIRLARAIPVEVRYDPVPAAPALISP
jgi:murein L,D-transpeptidase YcbB/YkuD